MRPSGSCSWKHYDDQTRIAWTWEWASWWCIVSLGIVEMLTVFRQFA